MDLAKRWNFQLLNRCSDKRILEVLPPPQVEASDMYTEKVSKISGEPLENEKKNFFSQKQPYQFFPTNKSDISEPNRDLVHCTIFQFTS